MLSEERLERHLGYIFTTEPYFDEGDRIPRLRVEIIDSSPNNHHVFHLDGDVNSFKELIAFLKRELDKASKKVYLP